MAWRVSAGLNKLLAQLNEQCPKRSKASDGSIGDPAHATTVSDHNPDRKGIVRARDFTHDPANGANMFVMTEQLRLSRDARIKYVIFNRRIFSSYRSGTRPAWTWGAYTGTNWHTKHAHVSTVTNDAVADAVHPWAINLTGGSMVNIQEESVSYLALTWREHMFAHMVESHTVGGLGPLRHEGVAAIKRLETKLDAVTELLRQIMDAGGQLPPDFSLAALLSHVDAKFADAEASEEERHDAMMAEVDRAEEIAAANLSPIELETLGTGDDPPPAARAAMGPPAQG